MNALELTGVCKRYPGFSLENIGFSLPMGCVMGLIGENGAGKSTTIKLILDMIRPDSGDIRVLGQSGLSVDQKEQLGVVLDEGCFPEGLTAVQLGAVMRRVYREWDDAVYLGYLERFSLPPKKQFREYSRGMKMKLGMAVALSHHARLLILDEATSGLDPIVRDELLDILYDFVADEQHAILLSSHIVSDLEKLCDYITFIHRGRMLFCDEKVRLAERYGLLRCSEAELAVLPPEAIVGRRSGETGVEVLVERAKAPAGLSLARPGIEEMMVLLSRGGKNR